MTILNIKERFEKKIKKTKGCWEWIAYIDKGTGYGKFGYGKSTITASRASWLIYRGKIKDGLMVCHKCDNRKCVKPSHLFLGTQKDNMTDAFNKSRMVIPFQSYMSDESHQTSKLTNQQVKLLESLKMVLLSCQLNTMLAR